jgi:hypothetical protein
VGSAGQRERTHKQAVCANRADPPSSERERVRARKLKPTFWSHQAARGREHGRGPSLTCVTHLSGDTGARAAWLG